MSRLLATAAAAVALAGMAGCAGGPPTGRTVQVQFRRDALGTASTSPVPPTTGNFNGGDTSVSGTLRSADGGWVVVDNPANHQTYWIPRGAVLLIQVMP